MRDWITARGPQYRLDILGDSVTPERVHDDALAVFQALHELPVAETMRPLADAMKDWLDSLIVPTDASAKHAESMAALYTAAQNVLSVIDPRHKGEDGRRQFRVALREEHEKFTGIVNRSLIVLPSKVKAAADHFNATLLTIAAPDDGGAARNNGTADAGQDMEAALAGAFERAVNCIRHHLAIDSLTSGLLREMGIGSESVALKRGRPGVNTLLAVGRPVR